MSLYVPRGYFTTAEAVERIFAARHPELAANAAAERSVETRRLYERFRAEFPGAYPPPAKFIDVIRLRDARLKRHAVMVGAMDAQSALRHHNTTAKQPEQPAGNFGEADLARLWELDRIASEEISLRHEAASELRAALAEGDLVATAGEAPLSKSRWREDDGLAIVSKGTLSDRVEGAPTRSVEYAVVIREVDLVRWLHSPPVGEQGAKSATDLGEIDRLLYKRATDTMIDDQITFVYDYAAQQKMKPPNINEIKHPVRARLISQGTSVTLARIETLAGKPKHEKRRRAVGVRVYDSFLPFSWPEIWKSGVEV